MIRSNLSVLLAQRNLTITQLAEETKLSRTTLNALHKNYAMGIQLATIDTICTYLNITPNELFLFHPVDFQMDLRYEMNKVVSTTLTIMKKGRKYIFPIQTYLHPAEHHIEKNLLLEIFLGQDDDERNDTAFIENTFKELPIEFQYDILDKVHSVIEAIVNQYSDENYFCDYEIHYSKKK